MFHHEPQLGEVFHANMSWKIAGYKRVQIKPNVFNVVALDQRPRILHDGLENFNPAAPFSSIDVVSQISNSKSPAARLLEQAHASKISILEKHFIVTHVDRLAISIYPDLRDRLRNRGASFQYQAIGCSPKGDVRGNRLVIVFDLASRTTEDGSKAVMHDITPCARRALIFGGLRTD